MGNPEYLLVDTDVLLQAFLARLKSPFGVFRQRFGVVAAVVPEVERETRFNKYGTRFEPDFLKLRDAGHVVTLGTAELRQLLSDRGERDPQITHVIQRYSQTAQQYALHIDEGEAYTHAAAITFGLPMVSNDWQAIRGLEAQGLPTGAPVLRFFDCLVLAEEENVLSAQKCQAIRDEFRRIGEHVPEAFDSHASFHDCRAQFKRRVTVRSDGANPPKPKHYKDVLYLERV